MENKKQDRSTSTVVHNEKGFTIHGEVNQKTGRIGQFTVTPDINIVHPRYSDAERRMRALILERTKREQEIRQAQFNAENQKRKQQRDNLVQAIVVGELMKSAL